jgi:chromosome segregation protein
MARFLKLERMDIHGFKSFYARTRFEFPEGITAVVGPNGCGKSNIGDAISWVLGEQKASSLRSDKMEDVIFNGSQGRRPLGMAEVSLHFKNVRAAAGAACGTIDPDAPGAPIVGVDAAPVLVEGNGSGHGNGHGAGNGNGHGLAEDVALIETAETIAVVPESVLADATAAADAAGDQDVAASRFVLEDLPEEVVVTRRLYRSGESEYVLNGRRCRLRDVQDLLTRTEIGTRLYTTIEQGKIDQILLAKPKERRSIIEEAAGILGYKNKRRQTEQKLEATQANLLRIADITGEVDKQIQSLRRQAAKARRYRRLMETLREKRAVVAWRRLLDCDAGLEAVRAALDDQRAREAAATADLARGEAEVEALRLALESAEEEARRRRDAIHALDLEADRLAQRLKAGEDQTRELTERATAADAETGALATSAGAREAQRDGLTAALADEAARVAEAETTLRQVEGGRDARAGAIAAAEGEIERLRGALVDRLDRLAETGRRRAGLEEQARSAAAGVERIEKEKADAAAAHDAIREAIERHSLTGSTMRAALEGRVRSHQEMAAALEASEQRLGASERQLEELRGRGAALEGRLEGLLAIEQQHAGMGEGVAEILRGAGGFAPRGVVGERIDVPPGLERAVAAALGRLQDAVVVGSIDEGARGVAHLRRQPKGRVAFVAEAGAGAPVEPSAAVAGQEGVFGILAAMVQGLDLESPVAARLRRVLLVADLDTAIRARVACPGFACVTRDGDLVEADGVLIGGDGPELQHGLLARRAERADLARQRETIERDRAGLEDGTAALRAATLALRADLEAATASVQSDQRELFQSELLLQQKESERARLEGALPLLAAEVERLGREHVERGVEAEALATGLLTEEEARHAAEAEIKAAAERLAAEREQLDAAQRSAGEARAVVAAGHQRLAALARERETVEDGLREIRQRVVRNAAEKDDIEARAAALRTQDTSLRGELDGTLVARAEAARTDEAALAGLAYDRSLMHSREQAAREGRVLLTGLRQSLQEEEIRKARLASDLGHLESTCRDDLNLTLEALRAAPPVLEAGRTLEEEEAEVARAREGIDAIGPVNLMAIEQCAELEERFTFLSAQKKDLEDSVESLRDTIRRINRESRQRFMAAFEAIQSGFQESFIALFGGGRAELRLQDGEEDVLEAGIEIAAQPPGKRLQALSLMSGGEKALTAVALLFALFRYRPSPFCVLDEVDAPLDEANVERFTGLLRGLTHDTQFILITHNRKSMEAANLLYGITMEEPGVSKVLPLRFE